MSRTIIATIFNARCVRVTLGKKPPTLDRSLSENAQALGNNKHPTGRTEPYGTDTKSACAHVRQKETFGPTEPFGKDHQ